MFEQKENLNSSCLYEELEGLDDLRDPISEQFEYSNRDFSFFNEKLEQYERKYGFSFPRFTPVTIPEIDFGMLEVEMFRKYSGNNVLRRAINGSQTIEERLEELEVDWKEMKVLIPRMEDPLYEQKRLELGELIPVKHLEKRGIGKIDNCFNGALVALAPLGVVYYFVCNELQKRVQQDPDFIRFAIGGALVLFSVFGLGAVGFASYKQDQYRGDHLYNESRLAAEFLDIKIEEVFR